MEKNLLNEEVFRIKEMMGLKPTKTPEVILEQWSAIARFIGSVAKDGGSFAKGLVKELIPNIGGFSRTIKVELDNILVDLASALRAGSDDLIKTSLKRIFELAEVGEGLAAGLGSRMAKQTGSGTIHEILTEAAASIKNKFPKMADADVVKYLKTELDKIMADFPALGTKLKDELIPLITWPGKGMKIIKITTDSVIDKLNMFNPGIWNKIVNEAPELVTALRQEIDNLISAGIKTEDEIAEHFIGEISKRFKGGANGKVAKNFKEMYNKFLKNWIPGEQKTVKWLTALTLVALIGEGAFGAFGKLARFFLTGGGPIKEKFDEMKDYIMDEENTDNNNNDNNNNNNNNNVTPTNCPGQEGWDKLCDEVMSPEAKTTFNPNTCSGTIQGMQVTWDGTGWV